MVDSSPQTIEQMQKQILELQCKVQELQANQQPSTIPSQQTHHEQARQLLTDANDLLISRISPKENSTEHDEPLLAALLSEQSTQLDTQPQAESQPFGQVHGMKLKVQAPSMEGQKVKYMVQGMLESVMATAAANGIEIQFDKGLAPKPAPAPAKPVLRDAETQTENAMLPQHAAEEHKAEVIVNNNVQNPENDSSGSFSNTLPSSGNSSSQKQPKERNPHRISQTDFDGNPEITYDLSHKKKVKIALWAEQNLLLVQIREFYNSGGRELPGKKGIALTTAQWRKLAAFMEDISEDVADIESSLSQDTSFLSRGEVDDFGSSLQQEQQYDHLRMTQQQLQQRHNGAGARDSTSRRGGYSSSRGAARGMNFNSGNRYF